MGSAALWGRSPSYSLLGVLKGRIFLSLPPTGLNQAIQSLAGLPFSVTPSLQLAGTGILTCFPSATPFGLTLGPDLPWADEPSPGTLGLSARWILTTFVATHAGILASQKSRPPFGNPSLLWERSPTAARRGAQPVASAPSLAPLHFRRKPASTSELLRTLYRMAASKPTSWLSKRIHILYHLARIWGP